MFSKTFRAGLALQIARAAIPGSAIATFLILNACSDQRQSLGRPVGPEAAARAENAFDDGTYYGKVVPLGPGNGRTYT